MATRRSTTTKAPKEEVEAQSDETVQETTETVEPDAQAEAEKAAAKAASEQAKAERQTLRDLKAGFKAQKAELTANYKVAKEALEAQRKALWAKYCEDWEVVVQAEKEAVAQANAPVENAA